MAEVVDIASARRHRAEHSAFAHWPRRLRFTPASGQTMAQLPDPVLAELAELNQNAVLALYDVVLGVRGWGVGEGFEDLDPARKMDALDAYLALADQVRFEVMRRLGWLKPDGAEHTPICQLAEGRVKDAAGQRELLPVYPRFEEMKKRLAMEPEAAIRSIIPEALTVFGRRTLS